MNDGAIDLWSTHLPVLVACVAKTTGPVLELGCGHYSTRVLHALCDAMERELLTVDVNQNWVDKFRDLHSPTHEICWAPDIANFIDLEASPGFRWSVVFEDSGRAQLRPDNIRAVREFADLIIVNNTEPDPKSSAPFRPVYHYDEIIPSFPYRWDYKRYSVWTSVLSDSPLPEWLAELT